MRETDVGDGGRQSFVHGPVANNVINDSCCQRSTWRPTTTLTHLICQSNVEPRLLGLFVTADLMCQSNFKPHLLCC